VRRWAAFHVFLQGDQSRRGIQSGETLRIDLEEFACFQAREEEGLENADTTIKKPNRQISCREVTKNTDEKAGGPREVAAGIGQGGTRGLFIDSAKSRGNDPLYRASPGLAFSLGTTRKRGVQRTC